MRRLAVFAPHSWTTVRRRQDAAAHLRDGHYRMLGLYDCLHPFRDHGLQPLQRHRIRINLLTGQAHYFDGLRSHDIGSIPRILDYAWLAERIEKGEGQHHLALRWCDPEMGRTILQESAMHEAAAVTAAMVTETPVRLATIEIVALLVSAIAVTGQRNLAGPDGESPNPICTTRHAIAEIRCADPVYA